MSMPAEAATVLPPEYCAYS